MSWLLFIFALEMGILPRIDDLTIIDSQQFYIEFDSRIYINEIFFIGGMVKTFITPTDHYTFEPFSSLYLFETGFEFNKLQFGFRHICQHSKELIFLYPHKTGGYEEIYFRIEGRF